jgi:two-component system, cell cycle sensor histidine kinase and response regulator CckA
VKRVLSAWSRSRYMFLSFVLLALAGGLVILRVYTASEAERQQEKVERFGQMLARAMWDLDDELARSSAAPILANEPYVRVRLTHPDGSPFVEVHRPHLDSPADRIFESLGLLPVESIKHPVVYAGAEIGAIEIDWRKHDVYAHFYVLAACALLGITLGVAVRNAVRQWELDRARLELERDMRLAVETKLQTREQQLMEVRRLEALGRLAGGVAHDFNNVLTAILGTAGLLMRKSSDPKEQEELQVIADASRRAAELTRQLLAFGRRQILRPRVLQLNDVLRGMQRILERVLGDEVELVLELDENLPTVCADPAQMEQVFMNLVVNAGDAIRGGGSVTIRSRLIPGGAASSHAEGDVRREDHVAIEVRDDGCGMSEETRARIFEPFFSTKQESGGTGLGLSTVYGIVRQSGGEILIDTVPDEGSTFTVLLAAAGEDVPEEPVAMQETSSRRSQGAHVLVVDDNEAVREVMVKTLRWAGHAVVEAEDGQQALEAIEGLEVLDVVVADLAMPRMGGLELAEHLRKRYPHLGLVMVSGLVPRFAAEQLATATDVVLLKKPFGATELTRVVAEVLEGAN